MPSPAEDGADPSLPLDDEDYNYENVEWKVLPDFVDRVRFGDVVLWAGPFTLSVNVPFSIFWHCSISLACRGLRKCMSERSRGIYSTQ